LCFQTTLTHILNCWLFGGFHKSFLCFREDYIQLLTVNYCYPNNYTSGEMISVTAVTIKKSSGRQNSRHAFACITFKWCFVIPVYIIRAAFSNSLQYLQPTCNGTMGWESQSTTKVKYFFKNLSHDYYTVSQKNKTPNSCP